MLFSVSITNKNSYVSSVIQEDRTIQLEAVIDDRLEYLAALSDSLLRWPLPRPILLRRYKQTLGCLAALSRQLTESKAADAQLAQQAVAPANMAGEVAAMLNTPEDTDRRPATPRQVTPEATDYLNGHETITFSASARPLFEDPTEEQSGELHPEIVALRAMIAQTPIEEPVVMTLEEVRAELTETTE
jgi:hypothetical protein